MADAIILATARAFEATLWTQDAHFKGIDSVNLVVKNRGHSDPKKLARQP